MTDHDVVIVGGGCVGCSVAMALAEADPSLSVALLEKEHHLAEHQSGRNSGVLHPGFNYPPGSLKARFATEGTRRMKAFAREHDVPLAELGVLVVAIDDAERARLHDIQARADENGVETEILESREQIHEHEPHAAGQAALYCPEAASIDSQQYVYALAREARDAGVEFHTRFEVERVRRHGETVTVDGPDRPITADYLVNAAGLYADQLAHQLGVGESYQIVPFRGEYYELVPDAREACRTMIYPTPDPELPFLGVHFTRRTDGKVIVGPNAVPAFGREAYHTTAFDLRELADTATFPGTWRLLGDAKIRRVALGELSKSVSKSRFVAAARRLVPDLDPADFVPSYSGNRAQVVSAEGELVKDPLFEHGPRSTHVLNAVSPGLTSSLPFGEHVAEQVIDRL